MGKWLLFLGANMAKNKNNKCCNHILQHYGRKTERRAEARTLHNPLFQRHGKKSDEIV